MPMQYQPYMNTMAYSPVVLPTIPGQPAVNTDPRHGTIFACSRQVWAISRSEISFSHIFSSFLGPNARAQAPPNDQAVCINLTQNPPVLDQRGQVHQPVFLFVPGSNTGTAPNTNTNLTSSKNSSSHNSSAGAGQPTVQQSIDPESDVQSQDTAPAPTRTFTAEDADAEEFFPKLAPIFLNACVDQDRKFMQSQHSLEVSQNVNSNQVSDQEVQNQVVQQNPMASWPCTANGAIGVTPHQMNTLPYTFVPVTNIQTGRQTTMAFPNPNANSQGGQIQPQLYQQQMQPVANQVQQRATQNQVRPQPQQEQQSHTSNQSSVQSSCNQATPPISGAYLLAFLA
jgi:hypothetical protein